MTEKVSSDSVRSKCSVCISKRYGTKAATSRSPVRKRLRIDDNGNSRINAITKTERCVWKHKHQFTARVTSVDEHEVHQLFRVCTYAT